MGGGEKAGKMIPRLNLRKQKSLDFSLTRHRVNHTVESKEELTSTTESSSACIPRSLEPTEIPINLNSPSPSSHRPLRRPTTGSPERINLWAIKNPSVCELKAAVAEFETIRLPVHSEGAFR